jgi:hypothetical protein
LAYGAQKKSFKGKNKKYFSFINTGTTSLNLGMDTQTPTGKLMLVVLAGVAQFKREIMLERVCCELLIQRKFAELVIRKRKKRLPVMIFSPSPN